MTQRCRNRGGPGKGQGKGLGRGRCGRGNTLRDMPGGCTVRIQDIACCPKERCRLLAMGLTPGTMAEINANTCGSCCLRVRDADIVLGDDLAGSITVSPVDADLLAR